ncbi:hypothetical protein ACLPHM_10370 [Paenalcaligenes sp. Me131]|uniref:hypothetical protein n=1 Tax=Paenalcaligenes sp. Me131 TaxID=3392636 RepID=UPI003D2CEA36
MHHSRTTAHSEPKVDKRIYRGTVLLSSAWQRCVRVLPVVVGLWLLSAWALGWFK